MSNVRRRLYQTRRAADCSLAVLLGLTLFRPITSACQTEQIQKGTVVRKVTVASSAEQSYALYLPSYYTPERTWPALFAFDPAARGSLPVECFRQAAEKYGYVVAGSNNSRNGPIEPSRLAAQAMFCDVARRFAIEESRLYATGYSGGGRAACAIGYMMKGRLTGVIDCGAGFPENVTFPKDPPPFAFCGIVGIEDYNWTEMKIVDRQLDPLRVPHQVLHFQGGHTWPPQEVATEAIEWMELHAMASGKRPKDEALIATLFQKGLENARSLEASGAFAESAKGYSDVAAAFKGLKEVAEIEARSASLRGSKEARAQVKKDTEDEESELRRMSQIRACLARLQDPEERLDSLNTLLGWISTYRDQTKDPNNHREAQRARRLQEYINIMAFYAAEPLRDKKDSALESTYLEIQSRIHPDSPSLQLRIARAHAKAGDKKRALAALEKAAEKGFSDESRIVDDPVFDPIREDNRYRRVIESVKSNRKK